MGLLTYGYIQAYSIFFVIFTVQVNNILIKRTEDFTERILVISIEIVLFIIVSFFCLKTIFSNPGIIPNNIDLEKEFIKNNVFTKNDFKLIISRGYFFRYKFCKTCLIIRPQGSSHCRICNICVERYDHHCPWVGNCIGMNNYK